MAARFLNWKKKSGERSRAIMALLFLQFVPHTTNLQQTTLEKIWKLSLNESVIIKYRVEILWQIGNCSFCFLKLPAAEASERNVGKGKYVYLIIEALICCILERCISYLLDDIFLFTQMSFISQIESIVAVWLWVDYKYLQMWFCLTATTYSFCSWWTHSGLFQSQKTLSSDILWRWFSYSLSISSSVCRPHLRSISSS